MEVRLPRLGEGADSGTVASVFVKEGDRVKKDQPVLELESEKAVASIPAPVAGTVAAIHVKEGDLVKVGQLILTLSDDAAATPPSAPARPIDASVGDEEPGEVQVPAQLPAAPSMIPHGMLLQEPPAGPPPAASPTIRKIARELDIDLRRVQGSERGGRIVMEDLRRYIQTLQHLAFAAQQQPSKVPAKEAAKPPASKVDFSRWGAVQTKKMTTLRRTISQRMVESWTSIPHITQFDEADVTKILELRKKFSAAYEQKGARLTVTSFALKALAATLKKHPIFNASMDEDAGEVIFKQYCHIGIAVDTEHGLIVPVLRDVDQKSMVQISVELQELAQRTRDRKVTLEEMQGGSFSVSNQGGIGSGHFTPIINKPEVAILGMGKSIVSPVVRDGNLVHRTVLPLSLSYDHRIIDGADAARFMVDLVHALETFAEEDVQIERGAS